MSIFLVLLRSILNWAFWARLLMSNTVSSFHWMVTKTVECCWYCSERHASLDQVREIILFHTAGWVFTVLILYSFNSSNVKWINSQEQAEFKTSLLVADRKTTECGGWGGQGGRGRVSLVYHSVTYINQLKCERNSGAQFSLLKK